MAVGWPSGFSVPAGTLNGRSLHWVHGGGVAERTIAPVLKTGVPERVPEVRILPPPLWAYKSARGFRQAAAKTRRRS